MYMKLVIYTQFKTSLTTGHHSICWPKLNHQIHAPFITMGEYNLESIKIYRLRLVDLLLENNRKTTIESKAQGWFSVSLLKQFVSSKSCSIEIYYLELTIDYQEWFAFKLTIYNEQSQFCMTALLMEIVLIISFSLSVVIYLW